VEIAGVPKGNGAMVPLDKSTKEGERRGGGVVSRKLATTQQKAIASASDQARKLARSLEEDKNIRTSTSKRPWTDFFIVYL